MNKNGRLRINKNGQRYVVSSQLQTMNARFPGHDITRTGQQLLFVNVLQCVGDSPSFQRSAASTSRAAGARSAPR